MTNSGAVRTSAKVFSLLVAFYLFVEMLHAIGQSIRGYYHFDVEAFGFAACVYLAISSIVGVSIWWRSRKTATE